MTIKRFYEHPFAVIKSHGDIKKFSWKCPVRELNPGRQGGKRERYLCATPTPKAPELFAEEISDVAMLIDREDTVHENLIVDRTHQLLVIAAFNYRDF
jgi:hypothetical protein